MMTIWKSKLLEEYDRKQALNTLSAGYDQAVLRVQELEAALVIQEERIKELEAENRELRFRATRRE